MRKTLIILVLTLLPLSATAGTEQLSGQPYHITSIVPGQPWQMSIRMNNPDRTPMDLTGKVYLATINAAPPLVEDLYARFRTEVSMIHPGWLMLSLSAEQTESLRGKNCIWTLSTVPDIGKAQLITAGRVEVRK
jgi:hypothetical protein